MNGKLKTEVKGGGSSNLSRSRRACLGCKFLKSKCEAPDDLSAACRRCARLGLACEYSEKPRGVPDDGSFGVKRHAPSADFEPRHLNRGAVARPIPPVPAPATSLEILQSMLHAAQARGDSSGMAHVMLLAGANGQFTPPRSPVCANK